MAYKRYYKKRRYKKKNYNNRAIMLAKKALRMINAEYKLIDTSSIALSVPDGGGTVVQLTNIAQGTTNITRVGNGLKIASIYTKVMLHIAAAASSSQVRIMLVHDRQTNGALFATTDLLESVTNIRGLISPRNIDHIRRFTVLFDKMYILNQNIASAISTTRYTKVYKKVDIHARYDGNAGDITDLSQSSLGLLLISNEATNVPTADVDVRIRFLDN